MIWSTPLLVFGQVEALIDIIRVIGDTRHKNGYSVFFVSKRSAASSSFSHWSLKRC